MAIDRLAARIGHIRWTASERAMGRLMRAPDGHDGGGAADAGGDGNGEAGGGAAGSGGEGGGEGAAAPWYGTLSAEGTGSAPSDRDWMTGKSFADLPAMVKSYRALETKLSERPKGIEVPGVDATDEQRAAWRTAIGVPEKAEGYEVAAPEGWEVEGTVLGPLAEAALKHDVPKAAFEGLAADFMQMQMAQHNARVDATNAERDAVFKEWGAQKDQNVELYRRGMEAMGFKPEHIEAFGMAKDGNTRFLMELGLKLGRLSNEDGFIPGGKRDFGITAEAARAKLTEREKDREWVQRLRDKDAATIAEHNRLIAVISDDDERRARAAQAA